MAYLNNIDKWAKKNSAICCPDVEKTKGSI